MDESEEHKQLQMIAYGRSSELKERAAAEARLASLVDIESDAHMQHGFLIPELEVNSKRSRCVGLAVVLFVLLLAAAVFHGTLFPERSTSVFDRPQAAKDLDPSFIGLSVSPSGTTVPGAAVPGSVRFLGEKDGSKAFGFKNYAGEVCLILQVELGGGIGDCADENDFDRNGLSLDLKNLSFSPPGSGRFEKPPLSAQWGPTGGLDFRE